MNRSYIALLRRLDAHATSHSRRTLLEHLQGTHDLLEAWGNEPDVCVAGLFHSVYGTYVFDSRSAELGMRGEIRDVIGPDAERLVHLFCVTDRRTFYEHLDESNVVLRDIIEDRDITLDRETLAALIEIEVANVVEQLPRRSKKKSRSAAEFYFGAFAKCRDYISPEAAAAAEQCFAGILSAPEVSA